MPEPITLPKLRTKDYVAERLDCSPCTVDRLRRAGQIGYVRVGGRIRFTDDHIANFITERSVEPCQENNPADQDKSANTGSANGPIAPCGAEPGSIQSLDRHAAHRSAQTILSKPS